MKPPKAELIRASERALKRFERSLVRLGKVDEELAIQLANHFNPDNLRIELYVERKRRI